MIVSFVRCWLLVGGLLFCVASSVHADERSILGPYYSAANEKFEYWSRYNADPARCGPRQDSEVRRAGRGQPQFYNPFTAVEMPKGQSPVYVKTDLSSPKNRRAARGDGLTLTYKVDDSTSVTMTNNGHTVELILDPAATEYSTGGAPPARSLSYDGVNYNLVNLHFHHPSEHLLDHKFYPMELHIVHEALPKRAVVAVMLQLGPAANPALTAIFGKMRSLTKKGDTAEIAFKGQNLIDLLPTSRKYTKYDGSLTTPNCDTGVTWLVMDTPINVSVEQVEQFKEAIKYGFPGYPVNARPIILDDRDW